MRWPASPHPWPSMALELPRNRSRAAAQVHVREKQLRAIKLYTVWNAV